MKKRVFILGGGISGLSLRYYLGSKHPDWEIILFEKQHRLGGMIETTQKEDFFFEKGPRTFKASKSHDLLNLIVELGMEGNILVSKKSVGRRFIWRNKRLYSVPSKLFSFLSSPLTRPLLRALIREWKESVKEGDETIDCFARRRFGNEVAEIFFDPLTLGIYAGDIRNLSIVSCFPFLKRLEKEHGSITKGLFKERRSTFSYPKGICASSLFTLREGMESLILQLKDRGVGKIHLGSPIESVSFSNGKVALKSGGMCWEGDHLFCALSSKGAEELMGGWSASIKSFYECLGRVNLSAIHLGYRRSLLSQKGFGYLIPSSEGEKILGVIFDSAVFPDQNRHEMETRLTVMMGGAFHPSLQEMKSEERLEEALVGIRNHLGICARPCYFDVFDYFDAIPQFTVGHEKRVSQLRAHLSERYPQVRVVGNYLDGVSISDCIGGAKSMAKFK